MATPSMPSVVIVDDDQAFGEFVRSVAQGCGYDVRLVSDGAAFRAGGLPAWPDPPWPDLIVLDLQMPGADGIELLRSLADGGCTASVLVMSGCDAKVVDAARHLGIARGLRMAPVLTKPVRPTELKAVLSDLRQRLDS